MWNSVAHEHVFQQCFLVNLAHSISRYRLDEVQHLRHLRSPHTSFRSSVLLCQYGGRCAKLVKCNCTKAQMDRVLGAV